ncbi:MAG: hypothetical protein GY841_01625 [FCB group bacterium]|nr:hypothetical protein [FCB group bacterium]
MAATDDKEIQSAGFRFFTIRIAPVLALGLGLLLTGLVYKHVDDSDQKQAKAEFRIITTDHLHTLKSSIQANLQALETVGAFFNSSDSVYRSEFKSFVEPLLAHHPEINTVCWAPLLREQNRNQSETAARIEGISGFEITEINNDGRLVRAGKREEYFPIYYAEPQIENAELLGYDLTSDSSFLDAVEWLNDLWMMTAVDKVPLDRGAKGLTGFTIFQPIYDTCQETRSIQDRINCLKGFVSVTYSIDKIVKTSLTGEDKTQFDLQIFDLSGSAQARQVYPTGDSKAGFSEIHSIWQNGAEIDFNEVFTVADRMFLAKYRPTPDFLAGQPASKAHLILLIGIITSLLICGLVLFVTLQSMKYRRDYLNLLKKADEVKATPDRQPVDV